MPLPRIIEALRAERNSTIRARLVQALTGVILAMAEALINIAQAVGIFPVTGIPLPLVSYSGTDMVVNLGVLGLMANIAANQGVCRTGKISLPRKASAA